MWSTSIKYHVYPGRNKKKISIAIWAGIFGKTMETRTFPIDTQIGIFHNEEEIAKWLITQNNTHVLYLDFCLIDHAPYIYTPEIEEALQRYSMLKNFNIPSYSNNFDDLPAKWVDTLSLINTEINKASEARNKK